MSIVTPSTLWAPLSVIFPVVAAFTEALISKPWAISSTYFLGTASLSFVGSATSTVAPVKSTLPVAVISVAPEIAPVLVIPPSLLSMLLELTLPTASTVKPVIVMVPIFKSPVPSISVAPEIAPVFVIPPLVLFIDFVTVSPSASTEKPAIVMVPVAKSPWIVASSNTFNFLSICVLWYSLILSSTTGFARAVPLKFI